MEKARELQKNIYFCFIDYAKAFDCVSQFSCSVASHSLWPPGLQHTKPPCPSPTPSLPKLTSIESVMPSYHLILCHPLLLQPPIFPSIRVFSNESDVCIRWPKYWSISFSISPSSEYLGLISFRMDWLDLLSVQRTLKSLLQHPSSKVSILQCSAFFTVQLSHPYMTTLTSTHDCVDHHKLWKILKEMRIPDHLICLLRNLYAGQEATVRTGHGTTDWFQIGKGVHQGCILSPWLFNLYAEYIMRNAGLEEAQAVIKIAGRNISIFRKWRRSKGPLD